MSRSGSLVVALLTLVALGTAACGGSDSPRSEGEDAPTAAATAARPRPTHREIILSTTTSTVDSGLLDELQPIFEEQTGYRLTILAQGSGAALKTAERGEADVVLAHSPEAELQFMAAGHGVRRELVMHNDFIVVGPPRDPANVRGSHDVRDAMQRIAARGAPFISRGDNSGTHALELTLWRGVGIVPKDTGWYQESGSGMGQTLQIANEKNAYTISDRATYLNLKRNLQLDVVREKDAALLNVYHVIQVDPQKSARVNAEGAAAFIDFLISPETQKRIGAYGVEKYGQPLFVPDHGKDERTLGEG